MKRVSSDTLDNKGLCDFFFTLSNPILVEKAGTIKEVKTFTCSCGSKRKVKTKSGYTNLMSHIKDQHPDYETLYKEHLDKVSIKNLKL